MIKSQNITEFRPLYWAEAVHRFTEIPLTNEMVMSEQHAMIQNHLSDLHYRVGAAVFDGYPETVKLFLDRVDNADINDVYDHPEDFLTCPTCKQMILEVYIALEGLE